MRLTSWSTRSKLCMNLVLCCMSSVQHKVSCGMASAYVSAGGNVVRSSAQFQGPPSPHRRVNSRNSCQGPHSPEVQANVKIKSLLKSMTRWLHSTGHVIDSNEYYIIHSIHAVLWALATHRGVPVEDYVPVFLYLPLGRWHRWLSCLSSVPVSNIPRSVGSKVRLQLLGISPRNTK